MTSSSSRRSFLAGSLGAAAVVPAAAQTAASKQPPLTYRTLGKTGLRVTTVGMGCMVTSDMSVIKRAVDLGINYFDTARVYMGGNNERLVGAALKESRKKVYLSTKVLKRNPKDAAADLDTSLRELGTDYIDIWYLHDIRSPEDLKPELIEVALKAKKDGKVRFPAFSVHMNHAAVIPAGVKTGAFDVLLTTYNFALGTQLDGLIQQARDAKLGIVAMKVMAGAFRLPGATDDKFQEKMKRPGAPVAALKWSLRTPLIDCAIPSIKDMDQLDEDIAAMAAPMSPADQKVLSAQLRDAGPLYCRGCGQCSGTCALGLPVPDLLRFAMYADGYGEFGLGRDAFLTLGAEARRTGCGDCAGCTVQCPNGVRVRERVERARDLFA
jgi:uncharacterized protein